MAGTTPARAVEGPGSGLRDRANDLALYKAAQQNERHGAPRLAFSTGTEVVDLPALRFG